MSGKKKINFNFKKSWNFKFEIFILRGIFHMKLYLKLITLLRYKQYLTIKWNKLNIVGWRKALQDFKNILMFIEWI